MGEVASAWFSPRGGWLATISIVDGECRLWRSGSWQAGPRFPAPRTSPFRRTSASRLWVANRARFNYAIPKLAGSSASCPLRTAAGSSTSLSPDGTRLHATVGREEKIHTWNLLQIRDGLRELGLDQGWPEFPPRLDYNSPPIVELELGIKLGVLKDRVRGIALPKPAEPLEAIIGDVVAYLTHRVEGGLQPEDMELALLAVQTLETVDRGDLAAGTAGVSQNWQLVPRTRWLFMPRIAPGRRVLSCPAQQRNSHRGHGAGRGKVRLGSLSRQGRPGRIGTSPPTVASSNSAMQNCCTGSITTVDSKWWASAWMRTAWHCHGTCGRNRSRGHPL